MGKVLQRDNIVRTSISLVSHIRFYSKTEISFLPFGLPSTCTYLLYTVTEKTHSQPLSKVEIFENAGLSFLSMISYSHRTGHAL